MGMVARGRRRLRAATGLAVTAVALALVAALMVTPATAAETCTYDSATKTVNATIAAGGTATLVVVGGSELHFGASPTACGAATTTNTDTINIAGEVGSAETLILDERGGIFGPGFATEFNIQEI